MWTPDRQADIQRIYDELWPGKCPRGRGWKVFHETLGDFDPAIVVGMLEEHARAGDGFPPKLSVLAGQIRDVLRAQARQKAREEQADTAPGITFEEFLRTTDWKWKSQVGTTFEERMKFVGPRLEKWKRGVSLERTIGLREPGEDE